MQRKRSFLHPDLGEYTVTKSTRAKRITLRIDKTGVPNVTVPFSVPFIAARSFFNQHTDWVKDRHEPQTQWQPGVVYELYDGTLVSAEATPGRNSTSKTTGLLKLKLNFKDQAKATQYATKAIHLTLESDSRAMVGPMIDSLVTEMGEVPESVRYRATTSRWGSCSSRRVLTFSVFIAQLPIDCIRYVVIHELAHLRHMNHSAEFWGFVAQFDPEYKKHRKELKEYSLRAEINTVD